MCYTKHYDRLIGHPPEPLQKLRNSKYCSTHNIHNKIDNTYIQITIAHISDPHRPYQGPPLTQLTRKQDGPTHTQNHPPPKKEPYPATTGHTITKRQDRNKTVQQHRPTTEGGPNERRNPATIIYIQTNMF